MSRLRINEVVIVEGKYDATALASLVDGLILTTDGFSIYSNQEQKTLIKELGKQRGILILTDSDAAGFQIREYIQKIATGCTIKHAYIPAVAGKESRKTQPSKEGTVGVEGMPPHVLLQALHQAGVGVAPHKTGREITYTDLYECGLSGGAGSADKRRAFLARVGLPQRLSKKALCQVLSSLYSYEEFMALLAPKPVLFWDFHGTLVLPDVVWFDAALEAAAQHAPEFVLERDVLVQYFHATCLPWYSMPDGDTRSLTAAGAWWRHCENNFVQMFRNCGFTQQQACRIAPALRPKILQHHRYRLFEDAIATLQTLQKRGYTNIMLSNNFPELGLVVEALGLRPYFTEVLVSGAIGYEKPRQEIFEVARAAAGNPAQVWMIGDNPRDDIEGGHAASFATALVHTQQSSVADFTLPNLSGLLEILP